MENFSQKQEGESQWLPISDLMSVLMMVFLLIAVSYMLKITIEKEKIEEVAITYNKLQNKLYQDLNQEFKEDFKKWDAEIDKTTLSVRFKSPEILFSEGSPKLNNKFKSILKEFFPRFIDVLNKKDYKNDIEEIRIEGHTSSRWREDTKDGVAYIKNMELSQNRTRNVLDYVLKNERDKVLIKWIRLNVTANGLSSSKLIYNDNGIEDSDLSRRVEFRVKTNAEKRIAKILSE
jgi:outer membrane protein OmpA-like peptidoglycan-associated protein